MNSEDIVNIPVDAVTGETHAHNESHVIARAAFMNLLIKTERCKELFLEWEKMAGWHESVLYLRAVSDELRALSESPSIDGERLILVMEAALEANRQFKQALDAYDGKSVMRDALRYTKEELGLPWKWLRNELVRCWVHHLGAWANGLLLHINLHYNRTDPEAPAESYTFEPQPGESTQERIARLREETERYAKEQEALEKKYRIKPGWPNDPQKIERDVEWFFRKEVIGESPRSIVDSYNDEIVNSYRDDDLVKDAPDVRYVRKRIKKARRLLTLAS